MDRRKIYIIYNHDQFSKASILEELKVEGYTYKFLFCDGTNIVDCLKYADEVWTWGVMEDNPAFHVAKDLNKDIWEMG